MARTYFHIPILEDSSFFTMPFIQGNPEDLLLPFRVRLSPIEVADLNQTALVRPWKGPSSLVPRPSTKANSRP